MREFLSGLVWGVVLIAPALIAAQLTGQLY